MRSTILMRSSAIILMAGVLACARNKEETGTAAVEDTVRARVDTTVGGYQGAGYDTLSGRADSVMGRADSLKADSLRMPADTLIQHDSIGMPKPDSARN